MGTLNLGILAHVDAGKTTLTERLLYAAGAIDAIGSVDEGTTQTDSTALERQRGITIRAAVASFTIDQVTVNVIDTPGHPDFIAEVDRSLGVLDGAVLVISAVEGVQAQTVVLMRALQRLRVPTLIFVNKIDRRGADAEGVLSAISQRLTPTVVAMGTVRNAGARGASFAPYDRDDAGFAEALVDVLAGHDDRLLAAVVEGRNAISSDELRSMLAAQTAAALAHPVLFGSAITGAGTAELLSAIASLLPAADGNADGPTDGVIFKVERGPSGQRLAFVRMFSGTIRVRDRLHLGRDHRATVTAIEVFEGGTAVERAAVTAGQIAKLFGLRDVQVGDNVGAASRSRSGSCAFPPPTLETVVVPRNPAHKAALHAALGQLAEQDPLINLRQDDARQELFVSLYGEVQKEVIHEVLATDFHIDVDFPETTIVCIERPKGSGASTEVLGQASNPFLATIGLSVEPALVNGGLHFRLEVEHGTMPLYVYKTVDAFRDSMEEYVREALEQGLSGWQVTDCTVTMTACGYTSPATTAGDFRKLTPLVLMTALQQAQTAVCEPVHRFTLDAPAETLGAVLRCLAKLGAVPEGPTMNGSWFSLGGTIRGAAVHRLQHQLRGLTHGEGVLEVRFDRYAAVVGTTPVRPRSDNNPLNRKEYLLHVLRRY